MRDRAYVQPAAILVVVLVVVVGASFGLSLVAGPSGAADGQTIRGQSPAQYQPENAGIDADPEDGEISVDTTPEHSRIVVDVRRAGDTTAADLEPITEAMFAAGHSVTVLDDDSTQGLGQALDGSSGLLIVQPVSEYPDNERDTIRSYVESGGHAVIAGEPTQVRIGGGLFATISRVSFGANDLTESYGVQIGSEMLYNVNDTANDNNFKSIYATPTRGGVLTEGVDTVTFDRSASLLIRDDGNATAHYTAVDGTRTIDTRRGGEYPVVVRNDSVVVVADGSFLSQPELYDADNEAFTGNLLSFLISGDPGGGFR